MKRKVTTEKSETLRRIFYCGLALIAVSLVCSPAFALDPMGPPAGEILKGEYKGGIEFCISSQDLETTPGTYTQHADGVLEASGKASLETIENFQTYRAYATVAYSPIHSWEAFLRLGATSATLGDEFWSEGEEFDSRTEFAIGGGLRATFFEEIALKIGGLIQANWSNFDGKVDASHWAAPHLLEIDLFEVQAALGATYMFSDRLSIYGGPFAHVIYGDLDYEYSEENVGDLITWRFNWDIEDDINYGGYFGARIALKRDCSFNIEYQQTSDASAIAASLLWRL